MILTFWLLAMSWYVINPHSQLTNPSQSRILLRRNYSVVSLGNGWTATSKHQPVCTSACIVVLPQTKLLLPFLQVCYLDSFQSIMPTSTSFCSLRNRPGFQHIESESVCSSNDLKQIDSSYCMSHKKLWLGWHCVTPAFTSHIRHTVGQLYITAKGASLVEGQMLH